MIDEKKLAQAIIDFGKAMADSGLPDERICGILTPASNTDNSQLDGAVSISLNDYCVIYPNEKGWDRIKSIIARGYRFSDKTAEMWVSRKKTIDGGYEDQIWVLFSDLAGLFYNGTDFLKTTNIKLVKNALK